MQTPKRPSDTLVSSNYMIMPDEANPLGNLMGGNLMRMMDEVAAISAMKHCERYVVTASVDNVSFGKAIKMGSILTIKANVTRAFTSSMEVYLEVKVQTKPNSKDFVSNEAFFTFVAVDQAGTPINVPEILPETEQEKKMFEDAIQRRELRLMLAGRIKPQEAKNLQSLIHQLSKSDSPK